MNMFCYVILRNFVSERELLKVYKKRSDLCEFEFFGDSEDNSLEEVRRRLRR